MNWLKHIFIKSKKDGELINSLQKNLFEKLHKFAENEPVFALQEMNSRTEGLNDREAENRLKIYGANIIADEKKTNHFLKLLDIFKSPLNLLLITLAVVNLIVGDARSAGVIIVMVLIVMGIGLGIIFIPSLAKPKILPSAQPVVTAPKEIIPPAPSSPEQQLTQTQKDYPILVQGTINFLDTKTLVKTTLTTADGKVYILSPAQPEVIYESFGVKNGQKVQVNAKSLDSTNLEWALMKPL